ncbi:hypothetical protein J2X17_001115 [Flavobacterium aquidurense]|nr:hypothetical protein [Flavobacterium aquidurense]
MTSTFIHSSLRVTVICSYITYMVKEKICSILHDTVEKVMSIQI